MRGCCIRVKAAHFGISWLNATLLILCLFTALSSGFQGQTRILMDFFLLWTVARLLAVAIELMLCFAIAAATVTPQAKEVGIKKLYISVKVTVVVMGKRNKP